jgi:hypothetical protein
MSVSSSDSIRSSVDKAGDSPGFYTASPKAEKFSPSSCEIEEGTPLSTNMSVSSSDSIRSSVDKAGLSSGSLSASSKADTPVASMKVTPPDSSKRVHPQSWAFRIIGRKLHEHEILLVNKEKVVDQDGLDFFVGTVNNSYEQYRRAEWEDCIQVKENNLNMVEVLKNHVPNIGESETCVKRSSESNSKFHKRWVENALDIKLDEDEILIIKKDYTGVGDKISFSINRASFKEYSDRFRIAKPDDFLEEYSGYLSKIIKIDSQVASDEVLAHDLQTHEVNNLPSKSQTGKRSTYAMGMVLTKIGKLKGKDGFVKNRTKGRKTIDDLSLQEGLSGDLLGSDSLPSIDEDSELTCIPAPTSAEDIQKQKDRKADYETQIGLVHDLFEGCARPDGPPDDHVTVYYRDVNKDESFSDIVKSGFCDDQEIPSDNELRADCPDYTGTPFDGVVSEADLKSLFDHSQGSGRKWNQLCKTQNCRGCEAKKCRFAPSPEKIQPSTRLRILSGNLDVVLLNFLNKKTPFRKGRTYESEEEKSAGKKFLGLTKDPDWRCMFIGEIPLYGHDEFFGEIFIALTKFVQREDISNIISRYGIQQRDSSLTSLLFVFKAVLDKVGVRQNKIPKEIEKLEEQISRLSSGEYQEEYDKKKRKLENSLLPADHVSSFLPQTLDEKKTSLDSSIASLQEEKNYLSNVDISLYPGDSKYSLRNQIVLTIAIKIRPSYVEGLNSNGINDLSGFNKVLRSESELRDVLEDKTLSGSKVIKKIKKTCLQGDAISMSFVEGKLSQVQIQEKKENIESSIEKLVTDYREAFIEREKVAKKLNRNPVGYERKDLERSSSMLARKLSGLIQSLAKAWYPNYLTGSRKVDLSTISIDGGEVNIPEMVNLTSMVQYPKLPKASDFVPIPSPPPSARFLALREAYRKEKEKEDIKRAELAETLKKNDLVDTRSARWEELTTKVHSRTPIYGENKRDGIIGWDIVTVEKMDAPILKDYMDQEDYVNKVKKFESEKCVGTDENVRHQAKNKDIWRSFQRSGLETFVSYYQKHQDVFTLMRDHPTLSYSEATLYQKQHDSIQKKDKTLETYVSIEDFKAMPSKAHFSLFMKNVKTLKGQKIEVSNEDGSKTQRMLAYLDLSNRDVFNLVDDWLTYVKRSRNSTPFSLLQYSQMTEEAFENAQHSFTSEVKHIYDVSSYVDFKNIMAKNRGPGEKFIKEKDTRHVVSYFIPGSDVEGGATVDPEKLGKEKNLFNSFVSLVTTYAQSKSDAKRSSVLGHPDVKELVSSGKSEGEAVDVFLRKFKTGDKFGKLVWEIRQLFEKDISKYRKEQEQAKEKREKDIARRADLAKAKKVKKANVVEKQQMKKSAKESMKLTTILPPEVEDISLNTMSTSCFKDDGKMFVIKTNVNTESGKSCVFGPFDSQLRVKGVIELVRKVGQITLYSWEAEAHKDVVDGWYVRAPIKRRREDKDDSIRDFTKQGANKSQAKSMMANNVSAKEFGGGSNEAFSFGDSLLLQECVDLMEKLFSAAVKNNEHKRLVSTTSVPFDYEEKWTGLVRDHWLKNEPEGQKIYFRDILVDLKSKRDAITSNTSSISKAKLQLLNKQIAQYTSSLKKLNNDDDDDSDDEGGFWANEDDSDSDDDDNGNLI